MKHLLGWSLLAMMALAILGTPARAVDPDTIKTAIDRGVRALRGMQSREGIWQHEHSEGATALAGLALLECGAAPDDDAVLRAADFLRRTAVIETHTYSVSLAILFFDRLGDPGDVPLIESLMVRLLAGQNTATGGWSYGCPKISNSEVQRLEGYVKGRKKSAGRREASKPGTKRKFEDLSPEIREQLRKLGQGESIAQQEAAPPGGPGGEVLVPGKLPADIIARLPGDNSNTQFAALALWVGRRHGLPVEKAITLLDRRFRGSQMEDGGWTYTPMSGSPMPGQMGHPSGIPSSAAMTCAGVLALAIADGATLEYLREHKPDAKVPDINKDQNLKRALEALGTVIGDPRGIEPFRRGYHPQAPPASRVGGGTYYFLWSLERVAVALDLKTIGKKDWYGWGAEILAENQSPDGSWTGAYPGGVDTSFALLFLKRANFARDLTEELRDKIGDPGERVLRAAVGINKNRLAKMKSGIESLNAKPLNPEAPRAISAEGAQLAELVLKSRPQRQTKLLEAMEKEKGSKYTEALAAAIPKLEGEARSKAREALANRLTRMKDETLVEYLQDEDDEIRRGAALAIGQKESKTLIPNLIALLRDHEISVVRAAHASLKALTERDFGPAVKATREERDQAVLKWTAWWSKQGKKAEKE
jgi:hypothetical protein